MTGIMETNLNFLVYLDTLAKLRVAPEDALFVGDRIWQDVWGPQSVGMRAVLIEVPYRKECIEGVCPDGRIRSLPELLPLVDGWLGEAELGDV